MRWLNGVVLVLGATIAGEMSAQAARDSIPFRAGQWGTEFVAGSSFNGAGILRFRSPLRAWLFDVVASLNSSSDEDAGTERESSGAQVELRFGHRWYRPLAPRLNQYLTLGALGSLARSTQDFGVDSRNKSATQGFGVFGAIGANWMVASQLSLGAAWQAQALYSRTRNDITVPPRPNLPCTDASCRSRRETDTFGTISLGSASLRLSLYY